MYKSSKLCFLKQNININSLLDDLIFPTRWSPEPEIPAVCVCLQYFSSFDLPTLPI